MSDVSVSGITAVKIGRKNMGGIDSSPLGNVKDSLELELTLNGEVLDGKVVLPVVGERLVERRVLLGSDILGVSGPEGLGLVELLVLSGGLRESYERE